MGERGQHWQQQKMLGGQADAGRPPQGDRSRRLVEFEGGEG
jgi:hypothetical protein